MLEKLLCAGDEKIQEIAAEEFPELTFNNIKCTGIYISVEDFRNILRQVRDKRIIQDSFKVLGECGIPRTTVGYYVYVPHGTHRERYRFEVRNRSTPKFGAGDFSAHVYKDHQELQTPFEQFAISNIGLRDH